MQMQVKIETGVHGYLPSRCHSLNLVLGGEGIALNQIIEVFGPEGSGKSTLLYEWLNIASQKGFIPILMDQERCAFKDRIAKFGLYSPTENQHGNFVYDRGIHIEDIFDRLDKHLKFVPKGTPVVVGIDSAGIVTSERNWTRAERDGKGAQQGSVAKAWWEELRIWFTKAEIHNVTVIVLNHETADFHNTSNNFAATTSPGGQGIKHCAVSRLTVSPYKMLTNEYGTPIGRALRVKTLKNKVAAPFQTCWIPIYFGNPALPPGQDFVGSYDALACLWYFKGHSDGSRDKKVINGKKVVNNRGSWNYFDIVDPNTGEIYANAESLADVKWQGDVDWCIRVFPEHQEAIHRLMSWVHFHPDTWTGNNLIVPGGSE
jgi:RecA/RadA recombinase